MLRSDMELGHKNCLKVIRKTVKINMTICVINLHKNLP